MKPTRFVVVIGMLLMAVVAGCGAPATPTPVPTVPPAPTSLPTQAPAAVQPTAQVVAAGFTPASVCTVPNVIGLDQSIAEDMLVKLGLQPVRSNQYDSSIAAGAVIAQKPSAEARLEPCKGDVNITVSLGPTPKPTNPPATPTLPATATAVPPTATPTPDPRLFWDDFENGVKPEWGMTGKFQAVNGELVTEDHAEAQLGDKTWTNYSVTFNDLQPSYPNLFRLRLREQDKDNYMMLYARSEGDGAWHYTWYKVVGGKEIEIPQTQVGIGHGKHKLTVEAENNVYRLLINGERQTFFVDDTFATGGIRLVVDNRENSRLRLGGFEVTRLAPSAPSSTPAPPSPLTLFWDDFENGVKPEWGMTGKFQAVNGELVTEDHAEAQLGDKTWTNYSVTFNDLQPSYPNLFRLRLREQDKDNYMMLYARSEGDGAWHYTWYKVVGGKEIEIPQTQVGIGHGKHKLTVEAENNVYRLLINGERQTFFVDDTFATGGIRLVVDNRENSHLRLGGFEVTRLAPSAPSSTPAPPSPLTLFWDNFENGVKPEWGMTGKFLAANGELVTGDHAEALLGDNTWTNYTILFTDLQPVYGNQYRLHLREHDKDNYMLLYARSEGDGAWHYTWYKVAGGKETEIPETQVGIGHGKQQLRIEADGSTYRVFLNGERRLVFTDGSFAQGKIRLVFENRDNTWLRLGEFEVDRIQ